eukprot:CAMPEP_0174369572 /NCGR_PEP_ID=MMETSP0811_2-20130205/92975_1 /TAXON_ID=73025 ORGANISM="Eutreptiella gymnastica-like, Strain CCMP1594" /NCGR_SAMPLE_ID=MMETSP0811_2 /ASSEMBLY_ACC=CAM_ASM_000667 /LENGTH=131 /DNA_ID=CAMNT_0015514147 /DNA_START=337 /DNA_END=728 /DNA_ORIENTATION=-
MSCTNVALGTIVVANSFGVAGRVSRGMGQHVPRCPSYHEKCALNIVHTTSHLQRPFTPPQIGLGPTKYRKGAEARPATGTHALNTSQTHAAPPRGGTAQHVDLHGPKAGTLPRIWTGQCRPEPYSSGWDCT